MGLWITSQKLIEYERQALTGRCLKSYGRQCLSGVSQMNEIATRA